MSDTQSVYQTYEGNSYLFGGNAPYVEEMYESYLANPGSVPDSWREYFDALQHVPAVDGSNARDVPVISIGRTRQDAISGLARAEQHPNAVWIEAIAAMRTAAGLPTQDDVEGAR